MLETVRQAINDLPCISFEEYYQYYVMDVQDFMIDLEIESFSKNPLTPEIINMEINRELEVFSSDK